MIEARTIEVLGLRTRVLDTRAEKPGDPIVLIHGVGGWAETWRAVIPALAEDRRVVAIDLPGFGESQAPGRVPYFEPGSAFYPRFVLATMDALGIGRAHVAGQSMGGTVAYMTAVSAPQRVRSLVLVAPGGLGSDVALTLRLCAIPGFGLLARLPRPRTAAIEALASCFHERSSMTKELIAEAMRYAHDSFPEFVRALAAALDHRGVRRTLREAWVARAQAYRNPVLVVWGREDRILPVSHVAETTRVFPQAEARIIERCGHLAMAERPQEFLSAALPFLVRAEAAVAA